MKRTHAWLVVALAASLTVDAFAAEPATAPATAPATLPQGDRRTFTITPTAPLADALHYRLRVDPIDQIDGDAAPQYLQALMLLPSQDELGAVDELNDAPDDATFLKLAAERAPWLTTELPPMLENATRRDHCDWGVSLRVENIRALLPYLNRVRAMANLLHAKTRLALARGDLAQALRLLQVTSTLADRVDDGTSVMVQNLVSVGVQALCMEDVQRVIDRPDGPNLYWALRQYPVPFSNLQSAAENERVTWINAFPALRKARDGDAITADDWRQLLKQLADYQAMMGPRPGTTQPDANGPANSLAAAVASLAALPAAREYWARTRHVTPEQAAAIEPARVVAAYQLETYQQRSDAIYKWFALPYPQMLSGLARTQASFGADANVGPTIAMFGLLLPSLNRFGMINARVDRIIAAFGCVEAIRSYAAAHDGKLPATLDAIVDTPAPLNPVDGQPFDYTLNADGSATLSDGGELIDFPMRYEIKLRR